MTFRDSSHRTKTPEWLRPLWERKNAETAARISAGVEMLLKQSQPATLAGLQQAILADTGVKLSRSTIQRSEAYRQQRRSAVRSRPNTELGAVLSDLGPLHRKRLLAKASRLRRENKERLIAKILLLETSVLQKSEIERALQQEVFRLQLASMPQR